MFCPLVFLDMRSSALGAWALGRTRMEAGFFHESVAARSEPGSFACLVTHGLFVAELVLHMAPSTLRSTCFTFRRGMRPLLATLSTLCRSSEEQILHHLWFQLDSRVLVSGPYARKNTAALSHVDSAGLVISWGSQHATSDMLRLSVTKPVAWAIAVTGTGR